uniref:Uncharacterized protein n=1 Tax=Haemonchus contortus TaxID=6289 RepID=A0A6F7PLM3_HAECO|nr:Hypothetical protein CBG04834 [Haemonchus contortus]
MLRLARELKHQSISRRDDSSEEDELHVERRRSARLNPKQEQEPIRDSGTESDEDELEEIAQNKLCVNNVEAFLSGSPPALSSSPPLASDIDTESWDSFGHESGILTGEGDLTSDDDGCPTPKPRRRMHGGAFSSMKYPKEQCEFPLINVCGIAEKRRYSMTEKTESEPVASRLRRNNDSPRDIIVAARRAPVRLLINKPYSSRSNACASNKTVSSASNSEVPCPAAKRNRCNSWRPYLDLEKMIRNRISNETPRSGVNKKDQHSQDH